MIKDELENLDTKGLDKLPKNVRESGEEDLENEKRKAKLESFKSELKSLMNKYELEVDSIDDYDGEDMYCGTEHYFIIDGKTWYSESITEIMKDNNK